MNKIADESLMSLYSDADIEMSQVLKGTGDPRQDLRDLRAFHSRTFDIEPGTQMHTLRSRAVEMALHRIEEEVGQLQAQAMNQARQIGRRRPKFW
jgi:hypothetical protein